MPQPWTIRREVDLARDFVGVERIAALATTSARAAHELRITVKSGGVPIDMDGASVELNLILPDGVSMTADGSIEAGACIAVLPPLCYQRGETRGVLMLKFGTQAGIPVYAFALRCFEDLTDAFVDPDHVIPSIEEILAQLDAMKTATSAAKTATSNANTATGKANTATTNANNAANNANTQAQAAESAAAAANAAAKSWGDSTAANSEKLGGKAPSAYTQSVDGVTPDSAGNVPLDVVSGSRYYSSYTAGGSGDVDYITDTFALVSIGTDKNPDLFVALGSVGSYAYVKTSFYSARTDTSRRYQVAYSYNATVQRKAWRTYSASGWQGWKTDAQLGDVPRFNLLDNSNFANPVVQAGLNGSHGSAAYLCDRWSSYGVTGEQKNGYIKLTGSVASSRITQNLDGVAGKTVTAAAKVSGSGRVYVGVYYTVDGTQTSVTKAVSAPNGIISARGTIPSNAESIGFRIYPDNSGENLPANVYWAALYEGEYTDDNLPTYVPKGYAEEMMECQRYYHLYATSAARPSNGLDCCPPMRLNSVTQGTATVDGETRYYNSADL